MRRPWRAMAPVAATSPRRFGSHAPARRQRLRAWAFGTLIALGAAPADRGLIFLPCPVQRLTVAHSRGLPPQRDDTQRIAVRRAVARDEFAFLIDDRHQPRHRHSVFAFDLLEGAQVFRPL